MANYITIDGGTTNTRISLVCDNKITDTLKFNVGARSGIEDKELLKTTVKKGIDELLSKYKVSVCRILASGMITSEFGLHKLDHAVLPAGIAELHDCMDEVVFDDISDIPFVFMRGVKTNSSDIENADMMRGEETELMGIAHNGACVYVLPGSHSKIIYTDENGRITKFSTMLTGEMIAAISGNTILKDAVSFEGVSIVKDYLVKGYDYCLEKGINEALFKVRVLKNLFGKTPDETYSFFMGIILSAEIKSIISAAPEKVVIGGKKQIKEATAMLLKEKCSCEIIIVPDKDVDNSSSAGMIRIYEY